MKIFIVNMMTVILLFSSANALLLPSFFTTKSTVVQKPKSDRAIMIESSREYRKNIMQYAINKDLLALAIYTDIDFLSRAKTEDDNYNQLESIEELIDNIQLCLIFDARWSKVEDAIVVPLERYLKGRGKIHRMTKITIYSDYGNQCHEFNDDGTPIMLTSYGRIDASSYFHLKNEFESFRYSFDLNEDEFYVYNEHFLQKRRTVRMKTEANGSMVYFYGFPLESMDAYTSVYAQKEDFDIPLGHREVLCSVSRILKNTLIQIINDNSEINYTFIQNTPCSIYYNITTHEDVLKDFLARSYMNNDRIFYLCNGITGNNSRVMNINKINIINTGKAFDRLLTWATVWNCNGGVNFLDYIFQQIATIYIMRNPFSEHRDLLLDNYEANDELLSEKDKKAFMKMARMEKQMNTLRKERKRVKLRDNIIDIFLDAKMMSAS